VQFTLAVDTEDSKKFEHSGCDDPTTLSAWVTKTTQAFKTLGNKMQAGELHDIEALGLQRHLSILSSDAEALGIGFTRALGLGQIRDTLKQIEAKWAY
jgi:hypothetical protein